MSNRKTFCAILFFLFILSDEAAIAQTNNYLREIKEEMKKEWPDNRTVNLVFHGHSVPSGYFKTPVVNTFGSYPFLVLKQLKTMYPNAVINVIITAIGGENSLQGVKRFEKTVLNHSPDVLFIDYALNDVRAGLARSKEAMETMIKQALEKGIKVILLTPSPNMSYDWIKPGNPLEQFTNQIIGLSGQYKIGIVDSYALFRNWTMRSGTGADSTAVTPLMSQTNHPNEKGHQLIADEIVKWFK